LGNFVRVLPPFLHLGNCDGGQRAALVKRRRLLSANDGIRGILAMLRSRELAVQLRTGSQTGGISPLFFDLCFSSTLQCVCLGEEWSPDTTVELCTLGFTQESKGRKGMCTRGLFARDLPERTPWYCRTWG